MGRTEKKGRGADKEDKTVNTVPQGPGEDWSLIRGQKRLKRGQLGEV